MELAGDIQAVKATLADMKEMLQVLLSKGGNVAESNVTVDLPGTTAQLPWYMEQDSEPPYHSTPQQRPSTIYSPPEPVSPPWYATEEVRPEPQPFSADFLLGVKKDSCSRNNFAANMVRRLFPEEERKCSNVKGVLGKKKLDPEKLSQVRKATFQLYPCESGEKEDNSWKLCCKAIDESCRRFNKEREKRKMKEKENVAPF